MSNDSYQGTRRRQGAAIVSLLTAGLMAPGDAPAASQARPLDERVQAVRERLAQLDKAGDAKAPSIPPRLAQWDKSSKWYNGWGNSGR